MQFIQWLYPRCICLRNNRCQCGFEHLYGSLSGIYLRNGIQIKKRPHLVWCGAMLITNRGKSILRIFSPIAMFYLSTWTNKRDDPTGGTKESPGSRLVLAQDFATILRPQTNSEKPNCCLAGAFDQEECLGQLKWSDDLGKYFLRTSSNRPSMANAPVEAWQPVDGKKR